MRDETHSPTHKHTHITHDMDAQLKTSEYVTKNSNMTVAQVACVCVWCVYVCVCVCGVCVCVCVCVGGVCVCVCGGWVCVCGGGCRA